MNKKFCPDCNQPSFYEDKLPNVCQNCGYSFAGIVIAKIKPQVIQRQEIQREERQESFRPQSERLNNLRRNTSRQEEHNEGADDENNNEFINTNFEPPEIELENIPTRNKVKLASIAVDRAPKEDIKRPKLKKMGKKQIEEDFRNDLNKSNRKNSVEIGGH